RRARRPRRREGRRRSLPRSYRPLFAELGDLGGGQAEDVAEDDVVVLAKARRPLLDVPVGPGEMEGDAVDPDVADLAVVDGWPQPPGGRTGVVVDAVLGCGHDRRGHADGLQLGYDIVA